MNLKTHSLHSTISVCLVFLFGFQSQANAQDGYFQKTTPVKWTKVLPQELDSLSQQESERDPIVNENKDDGNSVLSPNIDSPVDEDSEAENEATDLSPNSGEQSIASIAFANPFGTHESAFNPLSARSETIYGHSENYVATMKLVSQVPTGLYHDRLFFEEALLERHGFAKRPLDAEFTSAKRFLSTTVTMPFSRAGRRALRGQR